jgi:1-acyl-sn-glycerol-3-phosphate acyltransferase
MICANHISNLDPPLVGCAMQRKIHFMAKEELFKIPILAPIIRTLGAFPVKRGGGDHQALKTSIQLLKNGQVLGIFPEGTRSKTGELGKAHSGAALIALKANSPVVPVAIIGSYRLFRSIKVIFGKPIDVTPYTQGKIGTEQASALTECIMVQIRQMIEQHR